MWNCTANVSEQAVGQFQLHWFPVDFVGVGLHTNSRGKFNVVVDSVILPMRTALHCSKVPIIES